MADIKDMLLYLWQLPQNLLGEVLAWLFKADLHGQCENDRINGYFTATRFEKKWSGISLGDYIIFSENKYATEINIKHEQGHQIQSRYLGWFYLILIGFPSFVANLLHRKIKFDYYKTPWEASADRLGGVIRR